MRVHVGKETVTLLGTTVAGAQSSVVIPELGLVFDMGYLDERAVRESFVFVTHGHVDHIGALQLHAFRRRLCGLDTPLYVMPKACMTGFATIYEAAKRLSHRDNQFFVARYEAVAAETSRTRVKSFNGSLMHVTTLPTEHTVSSVAYIVLRTKQRLRKEYRGRNVAALVRAGVHVTEEWTYPFLTYTGDTRIEGVLQAPILESEVLICECTGLADMNHTVVRERGHVHEADLIEHASAFKNKVIVLCHFSQRYTTVQIQAAVDRLQPHFAISRIMAFTGA